MTECPIDYTKDGVNTSVRARFHQCKFNLHDASISSRSYLVQESTRISNRFHLLLDKYYVKVDASQIAGVPSLRKLSYTEILREHDNFVAHKHVNEIRQIIDDVKETEKRIDSLANKNKDAKLLMSITGLNAFGALLIVLEIDGIGRFPSAPKLVSWMGLCPTAYQSGNTLRHGMMRKDTNQRVNWMIIQATHTAACMTTGCVCSARRPEGTTRTE